jgi:transcriptional regulator with XRE-family HTH domain
MTHKRSQNKPRDLRSWRKDAGLSQRDAARQFGLSQPGWAKIELGQRHPRPDLAGRLTRATGVPLEVLMGIA